jgi:enoyl-CoA hydratase/carnithine racemase
LHQACSTPACRAVVLSGQGSWFSAGSDLKELGGNTPARMADIERAKAELARSVQQADVPVLAAVEGFALGGGVSLAASCDIVVSARDATWDMPEVRNGWLPPWGIEPVIARCGPYRSRRFLWSTRAMGAEDAHALGLVDVLCGSGEARSQAMRIAQELATLAPAAVRSVKRYLRDPARQDPVGADELATRFFIKHCVGDQAVATLAKFGKSL